MSFVTSWLLLPAVWEQPSRVCFVVCLVWRWLGEDPLLGFLLEHSGFCTRSPAALRPSRCRHCRLHSLPCALRGSGLCVLLAPRLRLLGVSLTWLQHGVPEGGGGGQQPPGEVGRNQRESLDLVMRSLGRKALSVGRRGQPSVTDRLTDTFQGGGGFKETPAPESWLLSWVSAEGPTGSGWEGEWVAPGGGADGVPGWREQVGGLRDLAGRV